jgi:hypothetical protein
MKTPRVSHEPLAAPPPAPRAIGRFARLVAVLLVAIGTASRAAPLLDQGGRMLKQWPTEDGYLMLTIARNMALGHGMSTADGTLPTNGTQPGFNFVEAAIFALTHGERRSGVLLTQGVSLALALVAAWTLFRLGQRILRERSWGGDAAAIAAAAWFASPNVVPHSMNCLETGLYHLLILRSLLVWHRFAERRAPEATVAPAGALGLGLLLGATLWARIDGVFVVAAVCLAHLGVGVARGGAAVRARFLEAALAGAVAVAVFSPWLIHNKTQFGSFMPISGTAQAFGAEPGDNLSSVPAKLAEYASVVVPIPDPLERTPGMLALWSVALVAWLAGVAVLRRFANASERAFMLVAALLLAFFAVYYGALFGAAYFMARYLSPLSIGCALATTAGAFALHARLRDGAARRALPVAGAVALLAMSAATNARLYRNGTSHMHFQVVEWTKSHVAEQQWMAAVQTGTLGFFHDRTVNLDGKVNPDALKHLIAGTTARYVVEGRFGPGQGAIEYLADWVGIARWIANDPISREFKLVVDDAALNLGVLQRVGAP